LGVTDFVDDTKPLWADIEDNGVITCMGPSCTQKKFATSGIYFMSRKTALEMPHPLKYTALREYLAELAASGKKVMSFPIHRSVDVDTPEDLEFAEEFIYKYFIKKPDSEWT
ncbi:MAG: hypothetical protein WCS77_10215, partial [Elusimicrobiaceae bacterium]